jgi:hypothetical protein
LQLIQSIDSTSLRLFEKIDEYCNMPSVKLEEYSNEVEQLLDFTIRLNVDSDMEIKSKLQELLYVVPLPNEQTDRMTK